MLKYWVWLSELKGLRNQTKLALLRRFGDPESIFYADPDELMLTEGADPGQLKLLENHDLAPADKILANCQRLDIQLLTFSDAAYPGRLKNIYDPPALLYYKGKLPLLDDLLSVAVVGTRDCTPYGVACAEKLGFGLASGGAVVVSGLAKGIDAAATRGALRAARCRSTVRLWALICRDCTQSDANSVKFTSSKRISPSFSSNWDS